MSRGSASGPNKWEEDPTGVAYWAVDAEVQAEYEAMLLKMSNRVQELSVHPSNLELCFMKYTLL